MLQIKFLDQKYCLFSICLLFFSTEMFAQKNQKEDVVYLKNGSIIRGNITEQKFGENIKIELLGGSIFVFAESEIDSIKKEDAVSFKKKSEIYRVSKGYRNFTETGLIVGIDQFGYGTDWGVYLHTVNGYQLNRFIYTGGGIGLERLTSYQESFLPLYGRVAVDLLNKKTTPFIFSDLGYAHFWTREDQGDWNWQENYKDRGGLYFSTGMGVRIFTSSKVSVVTGLTYKRTVHHKEFNNWNGFVQQKITYNRMGINVGVSF